MLPSICRPDISALPADTKAAFMQWLLSVCTNLTNTDMSILQAQEQTQLTTPASDVNFDTSQKDALLYIILVLGFYSLGVVIMMIKYLKRERIDLEEEKMLEDFLKLKPRTVTMERQRLSGKLCLNAFNAASVISQPEQPHGKVTCV